MSRNQSRRTAYLVAGLATVLGAGGGLVGFGFMLSEAFGGGKSDMWPLVLTPVAIAAVFLGLIASAFFVLAWKPRAWGKLICIVGLPWIFYSAAMVMVITTSKLPASGLMTVLAVLPAGGGLTLLGVGFLLLRLDRWRLFTRPIETA